LQSHSPLCTALLEDPKGSGKQFIVSSAGQSLWLKDAADAQSFFSSWKDELKKNTHIKYPTLHHIFYIAYEVGNLFETLPKPKTLVAGGLIWRHQPNWCICFDATKKKIYLSSTQSEVELDKLTSLVAAGNKKKTSVFKGEQEVTQPDSNANSQFNSGYQGAVEQVREYIKQGDVFQANIARFWETPFEEQQLLSLYAKLRAVNPAPFASFVRTDGLTIISASPERLFSIDISGQVSARPIAGTRKRSEGEEDDLLSDELLLSEKERSEHIMLLDLVRNDLGRVCEPGSILVDECMVIEKYTTVQHIVSNVIGKLKQNYDMLDVLQAVFPGGTITGCPKVRCMEIIHELEPQARGPYTGGIGYVAWNGSVDVNILIRTFWHWQDKLHWAAGAGIVADSVAEHEEAETEHKVAGLMRVFS